MLPDSQDLLIKFSKTGAWLAIYCQEGRSLKIYDSSDVHKCFEDIDENRPKCRIQIDDRFKTAKQLVFDENEKVVGLVSKSQVNLFSI